MDDSELWCGDYAPQKRTLQPLGTNAKERRGESETELR